ncbi:MAG: hypothetical protein J0H98_06630 [Solirubrobacterales bacterium]|nr:hypothetical protein [Solirubrobacterales bacterium]
MSVRSLLVAAVLACSSFLVAERAEAGVLDPSFAGDGVFSRVLSRAPAEVYPFGITEDRSGIKVFAQVNDDLGVFSYRGDGSPDLGFGRLGRRFYDMGLGSGDDPDEPRVAVPSGRGTTLVAGGTSEEGSYWMRESQVLMKLDSKGDLVKGFGHGGRVRFRALNPAETVSVSPAGSIFTGSVRPTRGGGFKGGDRVPAEGRVLKLDRRGRPVRGFGRGGIVRFSGGLGMKPIRVVADSRGGVFVLLQRRYKEERRTLLEAGLVHLDSHGRIDPGFGRNGRAEMPEFRLVPRDMLLRADGTLLVAGAKGQDRGVLISYRDGRFDRGFGDDGVLIDDGEFSEPFHDLVERGAGVLARRGSEIVGISRDGRFLASSRWPGSGRLQILRLGSGDLVSPLGTKGRPLIVGVHADLTPAEGYREAGEPVSEIRLSNSSSYNSLVRLDGGHLLTSFEVDDWATGFSRFAPGGRRESSFGPDGRAFPEDPKSFYFSRYFALGHGYAGMVGFANDAPGTHFLRISRRGRISTGQLEGFHRRLVGAAVSAPGGFLVAGSVKRSGGQRRGNQFKLARYRPDGRLDRRFGHRGFARASFALSATPQAMTRDSRGRIVVAGGQCQIWAICGGDEKKVGQRISVARFTPDGRLDRSFGRSGTVAHDYGREGSAISVIVLRDGRILMTAFNVCNQECGDHENLMMLNPDGSLDRGFGHGGRISFNVLLSTDLVRSMPAGRHGALRAGTVEPCRGDTTMCVVRIGRHGRPDRRFGGGDGVLLAPLRGMVGSWAKDALRQEPGTITFSGGVDYRGGYGQPEAAAALVRMRLGAADAHDVPFGGCRGG